MSFNGIGFDSDTIYLQKVYIIHGLNGIGFDSDTDCTIYWLMGWKVMIIGKGIIKVQCFVVYNVHILSIIL